MTVSFLVEMSYRSRTRRVQSIDDVVQVIHGDVFQVAAPGVEHALPRRTVIVRLQDDPTLFRRLFPGTAIKRLFHADRA